MGKPLAQPTKATAIRGNVFSYMLPWDSGMRKLSISWQENDFTAWPLDQATCCDIIRTQFVKGHEALIDHAKALTV